MYEMPEYQVQLLEFLDDVDMADEELFQWRRGRREGSPRVVAWVNCSDQFAWGCADGEDVESDEDLAALRQAREDAIAVFPDAKYDTDWALLWIARKRKMRPQGAAYSFIAEPLWPLFHEAGPERETGLGNPSEPGKYKPK